MVKEPRGYKQRDTKDNKHPWSLQVSINESWNKDCPPAYRRSKQEFKLLWMVIDIQGNDDAVNNLDEKNNQKYNGISFNQNDIENFRGQTF